MTLEPLLATGTSSWVSPVRDSPYRAELPLDKGFDVRGRNLRHSSINARLIEYLFQDPHEPPTHLFLNHGDHANRSGLIRHPPRIKVAEIYVLEHPPDRLGILRRHQPRRALRL